MFNQGATIEITKFKIPAVTRTLCILSLLRRETDKSIAAAFKNPNLVVSAKPRAGKPLFDPAGVGAIVMKRPDAAHIARFNKKCVSTTNGSDSTANLSL